MTEIPRKHHEWRTLRGVILLYDNAIPLELCKCQCLVNMRQTNSTDIFHWYCCRYRCYALYTNCMLSYLTIQWKLEANELFTFMICQYHDILIYHDIESNACKLSIKFQNYPNFSFFQPRDLYTSRDLMIRRSRGDWMQAPRGNGFKCLFTADIRCIIGRYS